MTSAIAEKEIAAIIAMKDHDDAISRFSGKSLFIYGAGNYGRIIYRLLVENGAPDDAFVGFLDTAGGSTLLGLPVQHPEDPNISALLRKEAEVIIAIYCSIKEQKSIAEYLRRLGYMNVHSCYETAISFHTANDPATRITTTGYLQANIENIVKGCGFWEDQRSLDTYLNHFIGYANCDVDRFLFETDHKQYFPPSPLRGKGHRRFIDCGAFDGDTVRDLCNEFGKVESLALFEPCERNFNKLQVFVKENESTLADLVLLFPCGVWDKSTQLRFNNNAAAASSVSEKGDGFIQCVALDDALHGFKPTCIKMDVEGAEPMALLGAESMIREHKPDLAISMYHSLAHFWEIPEMIRQWVPEYRLYLRTYAAAGYETVMYAVAKN
jgi:FkbM family methyltransferase